MANRGAILAGKNATPVLENIKGIKHDVVAVGTSILQIPATNLSHRKSLLIQNKHASNTLYIGGGIPYLVLGSSSEVYTDEDHDKRSLVWFVSANGTNEWFLATSAKGNPSLTQIRLLYYATAGSTADTVATSGTVSSLAAQHNWGWGDGDSLGWNTLYIRSNGITAANSPKVKYDYIHAYYFALTADDVASTGGIEIGPGDSWTLNADGSVRVFAIASGASTAVGLLEGV